VLASKDPADLATVRAADQALSRELGDCVVLDQDPSRTRFLAARGCGTRLAPYLTATTGGLPGVLATLDAAFDVRTTEVASAGLGGDGFVGTSPDPHDCGLDVSVCLKVSPLRLAVAFAGLTALGQSSPPGVPVPYLIAGQRPLARPPGAGLTGRAKLGPLGSTDALELPDGTGGGWSVRDLPVGKDRLVVVAQVSGPAGASPDLADSLTQAVAAAARETGAAKGK
jgi:hypothetical protein